MGKNIYIATPDKPYHFSVGAVVINEKKQVLCHHYKNIRNAKDLYILMRETHNPNETIEENLKRGLMEEFGAKAKVLTFLGTYEAIEPWFGETQEPVNVQKTTLYFLVELVEMDESKRKQDHPEKDSTLEWKSFSFLKDVMPRQAKEIDAMDVDESDVLCRAEKWLEQG